MFLLCFRIPNAAIRMDIQLLLIGFAFSALAIMAILTGRRQRAWVERDLYMGDLRTLSDIAFRRIAGPLLVRLIGCANADFW
jgi:hypothetical protein